jgi:iron complex transport system ATP-binding protein
MAKPVLAVEGLRIERGGVVILDGITWRVEPRQHWAILGPNGSGKTSMLKALTGYFMPTAGVITVLGGTYGRTDWRELRLRIGLVSSAIRQMIGDGEQAINAVISGKYAMVNYWGKVTPTWLIAPGSTSPRANASASSSAAP